MDPQIHVALPCDLDEMYLGKFERDNGLVYFEWQHLQSQVQVLQKGL